MGPQVHQLLATFCITSSIALVALGGSDLSSRFHLRTLSFGRLLHYRGGRWGYDIHSWRDVRGLGEVYKLSLPSTLLHLRGSGHFTFALMWLIKLVVALVHLYILSHDLPSSPYLIPYA
jgi:hypothetical protein